MVHRYLPDVFNIFDFSRAFETIQLRIVHKGRCLAFEGYWWSLGRKPQQNPENSKLCFAQTTKWGVSEGSKYRPRVVSFSSAILCLGAMKNVPSLWYRLKFRASRTTATVRTHRTRFRWPLTRLSLVTQYSWLQAW